jgi:hypothetical protein
MLCSEYPHLILKRKGRYLISFKIEGDKSTKRFASFYSDVVWIAWLDKYGRENFDITTNVVAKNFILAATGLMFGTRQLERTWHECYKADIPERS